MTAIKLWFNGLHAKSGGGLTYVQNMVPLLAKDSRFDLTVVLANGIPAPAGANVLYPPVWAEKLRSIGAEQIWLPLVASRAKADLIFSPANFGPLWGPPEVLLLSNSLLAGRGATRLALKLLWSAYGLATALSLKRCRAAIAVSQSIRDELAPGANGQNIPIIHHGVSALFEAGTIARENFLLAVGDIYVQKNFHGLIEAFALIAPRHPTLTLKIAGRAIDQAYKVQLDAMIEQAGITGRIVFLGHVAPPQLVDLYQRCKIFVFPSLAESFGMPILEAMKCGAPIILSNRSAMPEVAGGAGLLVDTTDKLAFAEAIGELLLDTNRAQRLGELGKSWTRSKGWEDVHQQTAAFLASLL